MCVSSCDCGSGPVTVLLSLDEVTGMVLRAGESGVFLVGVFGGE